MSNEWLGPARRFFRDPARLLLGVAMLVFAGMVSAYADYVPIWDGRIYADCVVDASRRLTFDSLRCGDHPTHGYIAWLVLAQLLSRGSFGLMLLTNAALGVVAIFAFHRIARSVFPGEERALERSALCLAFAVHPALLSSAIQINVDFGVMVFFLVSLAALLERRVHLAWLAGLCLSFSKETGAVFYAAMIGLYVLVFVTRAPGALATKWRAVRGLLPLLVPLLAMATYLFVRSRTPHTSLVWLGSPASDLVATVFSFDPRPPILANYLVLMFVVDFLWLPSLLVAVDLGWGVLRFVVGAGARPTDGADPTTVRFVQLLALALVFLITRVPFGSNTRYLLPAYPILLLVFALSLSRLPIRRTLRLAFVSLTALLLFVSNFATIEPISRRFFRSWEFGEHEMLDMLSRTVECCGHGRDQLVYNLEFTAIHYLLNQMLADIRPTADTSIAIDGRADWFLLEDVDPITFRRSLRGANTIRPRVIDVTNKKLSPGRFYASSGVRLQDLQELPPKLFYVSIPNVEDGLAMQLLGARYYEVGHKDYEHHGYVARLYLLALRPTAPAAAP
jgi:hypothetical protein